jgi:hypothetical protein
MLTHEGACEMLWSVVGCSAEGSRLVDGTINGTLFAFAAPLESLEPKEGRE